jgi:two-component system nitrogen regulation sensor histidine kinase NtrY
LIKFTLVTLSALFTITNPQIERVLLEENNRVNLTIIDTETGISDDIKNPIFIPYFTTRKEGSGIGLSISKSSMEAHKGKIYFNSKENDTNFVLTFFK